MTSTGQSGSGTFSGTTGEITVNGRQDLLSGAFTEVLSGRLCGAPR